MMCEWVSVNDKLPDKSGNYLTYNASYGGYQVLHYSIRHRKFNAFDDLARCENAIEVTHWTPLPNPPQKQRGDE